MVNGLNGECVLWSQGWIKDGYGRSDIWRTYRWITLFVPKCHLRVISAFYQKGIMLLKVIFAFDKTQILFKTFLTYLSNLGSKGAKKS